MEIRRDHLVRAGIGLAGLASIVLAVTALYDTQAPDGFEKELAETVGEIRHEKLVELTAEYRAEKPDGKILVVNGSQIAPLEYLNRELREMDATWRVQIEDQRVAFQEVT